MATFTVNGQTVTVEKNQKLIRYLRDTLHLTSVKDGCSEGACGTCHVLIDGKPTKACIPQTDKLEGKTIVTVEGLTDWEKQVYTFAFGEAGAVQCGFCIPGMVISAKGLLDGNPDPTREEAAFAIRNNICRCTGYVKIIDGILLAAEIFRAGILAVDKGQTEAARSLGLSSWQSMRLVVLPQAIKNVLPALANEVVTMVKESSICSVLGMAEIMYTAQTVSGNSYITLAPYVLAALVYFCINYPASKAIEAIERRMRRGDKQ